MLHAGHVEAKKVFCTGTANGGDDLVQVQYVISWSTSNDCCDQIAGSALVSRTLYVDGVQWGSSQYYYISIAAAQAAAGCQYALVPTTNQ